MTPPDNAGKLETQDVEARLRETPNWTLVDNALVREFPFATFRDAVAFVVRLGFDAEERDHHPDLDIRYRKVRVRWTTHSAGGVTQKDFDGVQLSDKISRQFPCSA